MHRPPTFFGTTQEITVGAAVYDRTREMPATIRKTIRNIIGITIELKRPIGCVRRVHYCPLRPATHGEKRQLAAIDSLHP